MKKVTIAIIEEPETCADCTHAESFGSGKLFCLIKKRRTELKNPYAEISRGCPLKYPSESPVGKIIASVAKGHHCIHCKFAPNNFADPSCTRRKLEDIYGCSGFEWDGDLNA